MGNGTSSHATNKKETAARSSLNNDDSSHSSALDNKNTSLQKREKELLIIESPPRAGPDQPSEHRHRGQTSFTALSSSSNSNFSSPSRPTLTPSTTTTAAAQRQQHQRQLFPSTSFSPQNDNEKTSTKSFSREPPNSFRRLNADFTSKLMSAETQQQQQKQQQQQQLPNLSFSLFSPRQQNQQSQEDRCAPMNEESHSSGHVLHQSSELDGDGSERGKGTLVFPSSSPLAHHHHHNNRVRFFNDIHLLPTPTEEGGKEKEEEERRHLNNRTSTVMSRGNERNVHAQEGPSCLVSARGAAIIGTSEDPRTTLQQLENANRKNAKGDYGTNDNDILANCAGSEKGEEIRESSVYCPNRKSSMSCLKGSRGSRSFSFSRSQQKSNPQENYVFQTSVVVAAAGFSSPSPTFVRDNPLPPSPPHAPTSPASPQRHHISQILVPQVSYQPEDDNLQIQRFPSFQAVGQNEEEEEETVQTRRRSPSGADSIRPHAVGNTKSSDSNSNATNQSSILVDSGGCGSITSQTGYNVGSSTTTTTTPTMQLLQLNTSNYNNSLNGVRRGLANLVLNARRGRGFFGTSPTASVMMGRTSSREAGVGDTSSINVSDPQIPFFSTESGMANFRRGNSPSYRRSPSPQLSLSSFTSSASQRVSSASRKPSAAQMLPLHYNHRPVQTPRRSPTANAPFSGPSSSSPPSPPSASFLNTSSSSVDFMKWSKPQLQQGNDEEVANFGRETGGGGERESSSRNDQNEPPRSAQMFQSEGVRHQSSLGIGAYMYGGGKARPPAAAAAAAAAASVVSAFPRKDAFGDEGGENTRGDTRKDKLDVSLGENNEQQSVGILRRKQSSETMTTTTTVIQMRRSPRVNVHGATPTAIRVGMSTEEALVLSENKQKSKHSQEAPYRPEIENLFKTNRNHGHHGPRNRPQNEISGSHFSTDVVENLGKEEASEGENFSDGDDDDEDNPLGIINEPNASERFRMPNSIKEMSTTVSQHQHREQQQDSSPLLELLSEESDEDENEDEGDERNQREIRVQKIEMCRKGEERKEPEISLSELSPPVNNNNNNNNSGTKYPTNKNNIVGNANGSSNTHKCLGSVRSGSSTILHVVPPSSSSSSLLVGGGFSNGGSYARLIPAPVALNTTRHPLLSTAKSEEEEEKVFGPTAAAIIHVVSDDRRSQHAQIESRSSGGEEGYQHMCIGDNSNSATEACGVSSSIRRTFVSDSSSSTVSTDNNTAAASSRDLNSGAFITTKKGRTAIKKENNGMYGSASSSTSPLPSPPRFPHDGPLHLGLFNSSPPRRLESSAVNIEPATKAPGGFAGEGSFSFPQTYPSIVGVTRSSASESPRDRSSAGVLGTTTTYNNSKYASPSLSLGETRSDGVGRDGANGDPFLSWRRLPQQNSTIGETKIGNAYSANEGEGETINNQIVGPSPLLGASPESAALRQQGLAGRSWGVSTLPFAPLLHAEYGADWPEECDEGSQFGAPSSKKCYGNLREHKKNTSGNINDTHTPRHPMYPKPPNPPPLPAASPAGVDNNNNDGDITLWKFPYEGATNISMTTDVPQLRRRSMMSRRLTQTNTGNFEGGSKDAEDSYALDDEDNTVHALLYSEEKRDSLWGGGTAASGSHSSSSSLLVNSGAPMSLRKLANSRRDTARPDESALAINNYIKKNLFRTSTCSSNNTFNNSNSDDKSPTKIDEDNGNRAEKEKDTNGRLLCVPPASFSSDITSRRRSSRQIAAARGSILMLSASARGSTSSLLVTVPPSTAAVNNESAASTTYGNSSPKRNAQSTFETDDEGRTIVARRPTHVDGCATIEVNISSDSLPSSAPTTTLVAPLIGKATVVVEDITLNAQSQRQGPNSHGGADPSFPCVITSGPPPIPTFNPTETCAFSYLPHQEEDSRCSASSSLLTAATGTVSSATVSSPKKSHRSSDGEDSSNVLLPDVHENKNEFDNYAHNPTTAHVFKKSLFENKIVAHPSSPPRRSTTELVSTPASSNPNAQPCPRSPNSRTLLRGDAVAVADVPGPLSPLPPPTPSRSVHSRGSFPRPPQSPSRRPLSHVNLDENPALFRHPVLALNMEQMTASQQQSATNTSSPKEREKSRDYEEHGKTVSQTLSTNEALDTNEKVDRRGPSSEAKESPKSSSFVSASSSSLMNNTKMSALPIGLTQLSSGTSLSGSEEGNGKVPPNQQMIESKNDQHCQTQTSELRADQRFTFEDHPNEELQNNKINMNMNVNANNEAAARSTMVSYVIVPPPPAALVLAATTEREDGRRKSERYRLVGEKDTNEKENFFESSHDYCLADLRGAENYKNKNNNKDNNNNNNTNSNARTCHDNDNDNDRSGSAVYVDDGREEKHSQTLVAATVGCGDLPSTSTTAASTTATQTAKETSSSVNSAEDSQIGRGTAEVVSISEGKGPVVAGFVKGSEEQCGKDENDADNHLFIEVQKQQTYLRVRIVTSFSSSSSSIASSSSSSDAGELPHNLDTKSLTPQISSSANTMYPSPPPKSPRKPAVARTLKSSANKIPLTTAAVEGRRTPPGEKTPTATETTTPPIVRGRGSGNNSTATKSTAMSIADLVPRSFDKKMESEEKEKKKEMSKKATTNYPSPENINNNKSQVASIFLNANGERGDSSTHVNISSSSSSNKNYQQLVLFPSLSQMAFSSEEKESTFSVNNNNPAKKTDNNNNSGNEQHPPCGGLGGTSIVSGFGVNLDFSFPSKEESNRNHGTDDLNTFCGNFSLHAVEDDVDGAHDDVGSSSSMAAKGNLVHLLLPPSNSTSLRRGFSFFTKPTPTNDERVKPNTTKKQTEKRGEHASCNNGCEGEEEEEQRKRQAACLNGMVSPSSTSASAHESNTTFKKKSNNSKSNNKSPSKGVLANRQAQVRRPPSDSSSPEDTRRTDDGIMVDAVQIENNNILLVSPSAAVAPNDDNSNSNGSSHNNPTTTTTVSSSTTEPNDTNEANGRGFGTNDNEDSTSNNNNNDSGDHNYLSFPQPAAFQPTASFSETRHPFSNVGVGVGGGGFVAGRGLRQGRESHGLHFSHSPSPSPPAPSLTVVVSSEHTISSPKSRHLANALRGDDSLCSLGQQMHAQAEVNPTGSKAKAPIISASPPSSSSRPHGPAPGRFASEMNTHHAHANPSTADPQQDGARTGLPPTLSPFSPPPLSPAPPSKPSPTKAAPRGTSLRREWDTCKEEFHKEAVSSPAATNITTPSLLSAFEPAPPPQLDVERSMLTQPNNNNNNNNNTLTIMSATSTYNNNNIMASTKDTAGKSQMNINEDSNALSCWSQSNRASIGGGGGVGGISINGASTNTAVSLSTTSPSSHSFAAHSSSRSAATSSVRICSSSYTRGSGAANSLRVPDGGANTDGRHLSLLGEDISHHPATGSVTNPENNKQ